ncbi:MAG: hypothetical protein M3016_00795 [Actinomycetota bacterium]|nr:hypothetical protein [Actinomycetota bacterium]
MAPSFVTRSLIRAVDHVPGLRRIPAVRLLAIAELGLIARDHLLRLTPEERRRLITLVRHGHGRPSHLTTVEREELAVLVAKLEPRRLVGETAERLSPVPLPKRMVRGSARSRQGNHKR